MTRKAEEKSKEPLNPSTRKALRKQKEDQKTKQNLTKDYAYTDKFSKKGPHSRVAEATAKGVRITRRGGGRTNLLEELGRVEGESSNRNRRAEVSRIHGELNKGYKKGGRAAFKHGKYVKVATPHADIAKYVEKDSSKSPEHYRKEGSTLEMGKKRGGRRAGQATRDPGKKFKVKIIKMSLGGRVGAATHGFNKKILRTD